MITRLGQRTISSPALDLLWRAVAIAIIALGIFVGLPGLARLGA